MRGIFPCKLGKTEQIRGSGFPGIIDAGYAQPQTAGLFGQQKVVIVMVAVKQEAVVGQGPETPREDGNIRTLDLSGLFLFIRGTAVPGNGVFFLTGNIFGQTGRRFCSIQS